MQKPLNILACCTLCLILLGAGGAIGQSSGSIVTWGNISAPPAPNEDFVVVVANGAIVAPAELSWEYALALKSDGNIVAWGDNGSGECDVPEPNADFITIAAGAAHGLGIRSDETIVAWGENGHGQCDVPAPNADFVAIAAGSQHSLGLKSDGTIVAWGRNEEGQCNIPSPNADFTAIAAGNYHNLGLKSYGTIVTWGYNMQGQCDVPAPNVDFGAVVAGGWHSLGLKSDGAVVAWGSGAQGQCSVPAPNTNFVEVAAGWQHSLALKSDGTIVAWGRNSAGQCDVPEPNTDFVAIAAAVFSSLAIQHESVGVEGDVIADEPEEPGADEEVPVAALRLAVHPNPFNPQTTITFTLERDEWAIVSVFELTGRRVALLADRTFDAGTHSLTWSGRDEAGRSMPSGTYLVRLETESAVRAQKLMLLR